MSLAAAKSSSWKTSGDLISDPADRHEVQAYSLDVLAAYFIHRIVIELLDGFSNVLKIRVEEEPVTQHHFSKLLDVQLTTTINWK